MFASKPNKIRQRTVTVPIKKAVTTPTNPASANGVRTPASAPPANRFQLTPANKTRMSSSAQSQPQRKSLSVSHQRKRKLTPCTPDWGSSDSSSEEEDDYSVGSSGKSKRPKTSPSVEPMGLNRCLPPDRNRRIRYQLSSDEREKDKGQNPTEKRVDGVKLIHGWEMTSGEFKKDYEPVFRGSEGDGLFVELQYPSHSRPERFEIAQPKDDSFHPVNDICSSIEEIIAHYLPSELSTKLSSDLDGTVRLLKRAVTKQSPAAFKTTLDDFNKTIQSNLASNTIPSVLDALDAVPLSLIRRIIIQVYSRTVSPHSQLLRRVKGKETTYGELLPPFIHKIFHQTGLNSKSVFIDLGSGVGNVVLQSALQTGAESYGIEILEFPVKLALQQAAELRARARLWNLSLGPMTLLHGDFRESQQVDDVLRRADVVLVNNKVFGQKLNEQLLNKFLDLKQGCKVVSLESFGGGGGKQGVRNEQSIAANLFDEERFESGTEGVSWANESVEYFIATRR